MAGESEGRRSSHTKVADSPASNVPSFGRLRGKALSSTSVGNRSQASIRSARSDKPGELLPGACISEAFIFCIEHIVYVLAIQGQHRWKMRSQ